MAALGLKRSEVGETGGPFWGAHTRWRADPLCTEHPSKCTKCIKEDGVEFRAVRGEAGRAEQVTGRLRLRRRGEGPGPVPDALYFPWRQELMSMSFSTTAARTGGRLSSPHVHPHPLPPAQADVSRHTKIVNFVARSLQSVLVVPVSLRVAAVPGKTLSVGT